MNRTTAKWMLVTLGVPAGIAAAFAAPAAAAAGPAPPAGGADTLILWKPPMPCIPLRADLSPSGAGFCPSSDGLDWHEIAARLGHRPTADSGAADPSADADITWETTRHPITVELLTPTDSSTDGATIGFVVTLDGEVAGQPATADSPQLVVWLTMNTPGEAVPSAGPPESSCPAIPGSADDFVPGSRRMPRC